MPAITLKAHFDGRQIVLDEAFGLTPGTQLLVTVMLTVQAEEMDLERNAWAELAAQSLSRAYGESEPEYSEADVKDRV
ncbi:MAG TPA: hypothetical protein VFE47_00290 [Tepidisphaeraceae bacterium]|jgi:hypothetical protein|nr:hypothetical protein [Tepidisphaeraceae bacterium]